MPKSDLAVFARFCTALELEQGGPMTLEPFQRRILTDYFAGTRELLVLLPKKNGKTTLLAALALFHLLTTPDAECVVAAASREQAMILFDAAVGFIRRSPGLSRRLKTQGGYRQIRNLADSGRIRVLAADVDTADGVRPTLAAVDELHRHRSAELYGVFRDGLGPRNGQMVTISTAGEHEASPLGRMRAAARQLEHQARKGAYLHVRSNNRAFAMHEWALDDQDDVHDMRVVKHANPARWHTLDLLQERHDSPSTLPWQWARFACGLWVSSQSWWLDPEQWRDATVTDHLQDGDRIAVGFDGARTGDATALVACRLTDGLIQPLGVWEDPVDGRDWEVPAGEVDACLADAMERYRVVRGYFDPPLWQTEIDNWAGEFGETQVMRFATQRARMISAVERFRTDLAAGRLKHTGHETLSRHALNAQMREVRGGYWLGKPGSGPADKIDAAVAAVLAYEARADAIAAGANKPAGRLLTF
ncbi:MAG TPA: terminase large subunit [Acidimicrobiales bacterium]|nr:terminase large subunit [Acidimicrobiales bacterium]